MPIDFDALKKIDVINLGDYHPYYKGQTLEVWVNPSRRVWNDFADETIDLDKRVRAYYCAIWDIQATEFNLLIGDEDQEGAESGLWNYLISETNRLLSEYTDARKKAEKD